MPISWKGTLQQYAGRLHREHANKSSVRIIDFVDAGHPALLRMWERRQRGYKAMGYRFPSAMVSDNLDLDLAQVCQLLAHFPTSSAANPHGCWGLS